MLLIPDYRTTLNRILYLDLQSKYIPKGDLNIDPSSPSYAYYDLNSMHSNSEKNRNQKSGLDATLTTMSLFARS